MGLIPFLDVAEGCLQKWSRREVSYSPRADAEATD